VFLLLPFQPIGLMFIVHTIYLRVVVSHATFEVL